MRYPRQFFALYVLFEETVPEWVSQIMQWEMVNLAVASDTIIRIRR